MVAQVRRQRAGPRVSAEARPRDQPTERSCRRRCHAGPRQRLFAPPRSRWRSWRSFAAISTIDAYRSCPSMSWTATTNREERRRATNQILTERRWSSPPELRRSKQRPRLSNDLPISGEGRPGWSIVALPGPRGGRCSSGEPRGPGSSDTDRELSAFVRFIGLFDNGTAPSSCADRRGRGSATSGADLRRNAE